MARPRRHTEELREQLIQAATELVSMEGTDFALRPLAESLGTSTTAVYALFGSRAALVSEVAVRAIEAAVTNLHTCRHEDPIRWTLCLGMSYRRYVQAHPAIFDLVLGEDGLSEEVAAARGKVLACVGEAVRAAVDAGLLEGDPDLIMRSLVASGHGFLMLEQMGLMSGDAHFCELHRSIMYSYATAAGREHLSRNFALLEAHGFSGLEPALAPSR